MDSIKGILIVFGMAVLLGLGVVAYDLNVNNQENNNRHKYIIHTIDGSWEISDELPFEEITKLIGSDEKLYCGWKDSDEDEVVFDMKKVISISKY